MALKTHNGTSPYSDPGSYDGKFAWFVADVPFYHRCALAWGAPALELGCGTGRVTIPLAKIGVAMVGLDGSAAMLAVARERAREQGVRLELARADFRDFDLGRRFPLVIFPFNGLAHLHDDRDLFSCLAAAERHLAARGRLVLDVPNPRPGGSDKAADHLMAIYRDRFGREVEVWEESEYDPARRRCRVRWRHVSEEGERVEEIVLRVFLPLELEALLDRAGFVTELRLGDYDDSAFAPDSPQQLLVCRPKES